MPNSEDTGALLGAAEVAAPVLAAAGGHVAPRAPGWRRLGRRRSRAARARAAAILAARARAASTFSSRLDSACMPVSRRCSAALRAATWAACCLLGGEPVELRPWRRRRGVAGALVAASSAFSRCYLGGASRGAAPRRGPRRGGGWPARWRAGPASGSARPSRCRPCAIGRRTPRGSVPQAPWPAARCPGPGRSARRTGRRGCGCRRCRRRSWRARRRPGPRWPGRPRAPTAISSLRWSALASGGVGRRRAVACAAGQRGLGALQRDVGGREVGRRLVRAGP